MENKQAIANIKQGKNIPYKHETITTLVKMAEKLEKIKQILDDCDLEAWEVLKMIKEVVE